ncbi:MAG: glycosyltransferase [Chthoniobacterales bacterium]
MSLIIPCWRDGELVSRLLRRDVGQNETIVILAMPDEGLVGRLRDLGATVIVSNEANRGHQLALGAEAASGDVLVFHHADSEIEEGQVRAVVEVMGDSRIVGGAFHRKFDGRHPLFRWIEPVERWRALRFGALFGDQSIFVRRSHYEAIGGFRNLPLMEDVEFSNRLRRSGRIALLDPPMTTSDRAHREGGAWRTSIRNGLFLLLFRCGVSPDRLHTWYYRRKEVESL